MANDSSMLNIDMVEQFGKNIANVSAQTLEIFSRLGQQLQTVNSVWNDDNYDNFQDNFEHNMSCLICMVNDICSPYTFAVSHIAF